MAVGPLRFTGRVLDMDPDLERHLDHHLDHLDHLDHRPDHRRAPEHGRTEPMLVSRDPALGEEVTRLAAAAGVTMVVVDDPATALAPWPSASVVLVGADLAAELAVLRPPRRAGVHVLGWSGQPDATYRSGLLLGAEHVLELPDAAEQLTDALTDLDAGPTGEARVVGVLGGSGGAGATTLACALGQQLGHDGASLVLDLDPWGPGADQVLGLGRSPGVRWGDLSESVGRLSGRSLREAVPRRDGVGVLTWASGSAGPLEPPVLREALSAACRGHDNVVVDLPRTTDHLAAEVVARCGLVALVVQPTLTGVSAAIRAAAHLPDRARLGVVVRETRGVTADPARVAAAIGAPLVAVLRDQRGLAESVDLGLGPTRSRRGPLARACRQLMAA